MRKDQVFLLALLGYIGGVFAGSFFVVSGWMLLLGIAVWGSVAVTFPRKNIFLLLFPLLLFAFCVFSIMQSLEHFHAGNIQAREVSGVGAPSVIRKRKVSTIRSSFGWKYAKGASVLRKKSSGRRRKLLPSLPERASHFPACWSCRKTSIRLSIIGCSWPKMISDMFAARHHRGQSCRKIPQDASYDFFSGRNTLLKRRWKKVCPSRKRD